MNAFKLHDQLNVQARNLVVGLTRKVCVVSCVLPWDGTAYVVRKQTEDILFSPLSALQLCFALSILGNSPVLILDEPSTGLDVSGKQQMW